MLHFMKKKKLKLKTMLNILLILTFSLSTTKTWAISQNLQPDFGHIVPRSDQEALVECVRDRDACEQHLKNNSPAGVDVGREIFYIAAATAIGFIVGYNAKR